MKYVIIYLICSIGLHKSVTADLFLDKFIRIITGVESFFSTTFDSNCQDLKSFLGMNSDQFIANNKTPNLTKVKVGLQVKNVSYMFNFISSASEILASPHFNKSLPVAFYVHGFLSNTQSPNLVQTVRSLVNRGRSNVIFLDASALIYSFYMYATTCVEFIGIELGKQLAILINGGTKSKDMHLLGFSLGAHISGFAGQTLKNITGSKIGRISAFDAAGPCYFNSDDNERLSPDDADFVDVIHTDAGVFGISKPIGHVDFYVNGGNSQPRALFLFESHLRSWQYFNETLLSENEKNFPAVECSCWHDFKRGKCIKNNITYMGIATPSSARGIFYLRTRDTVTYPFGLKEEGTQPENNPFWNFIAWFLSLFGITI